MNEQACCAHLRIGYKPDDWPGGGRSDRWECVDCGERFYPSQHDQRKARLLDEFAMAALTSTDWTEWGTVEGAASQMYKMADAMFAHKEKRSAKPSGKT